MIALTSLLLAGGPAAMPAAWHDGLQWRGQTAGMTTQAAGGYVLKGPFGEREIPAQRASAQTISPLFDDLFAIAQQELAEDSVPAVRDPAYDHGRPMACRCVVWFPGELHITPLDAGTMPP